LLFVSSKTFMTLFWYQPSSYCTSLVYMATRSPRSIISVAYPRRTAWSRESTYGFRRITWLEAINNGEILRPRQVRPCIAGVNGGRFPFSLSPPPLFWNVRYTGYNDTYRVLPFFHRFRKFLSEVKWKGPFRFNYFRPEYSGSPQEMVHLFRSEYSDRNNSPFIWQIGSLPTSLNFSVILLIRKRNNG